jgi:pilus assembly protein CpaE
VVFCAGNMRNAALLRELASLADNIEIIAAQSIIELDATRRLLDQIAIEKPALRKARLLLWDHQPSVLLDGRRMADILEIDTVLGVPTDRARVRNAVNLGRPLACESQGGSYMNAIHRITNVTKKESKGPFMRMRQALDRRSGVERRA